MIALENMKKVSQNQFNYISANEWNWKPEVKDLNQIDKSLIEASGSNTTSKSTFTTQMDHGENQ